jgi:hypothetical protein
MFSSKVLRAVQKRVSILRGRCGSNGLLPNQLFLTSMRSDGPREFTTNPKSDAPRLLDWAEFRGNRAWNTKCGNNLWPSTLRRSGAWPNFPKKATECVAIGIRSMRVKFLGHAVWLGCKNIGLPSRPKRLFLVVSTCGNYQKCNIL